MPDSGDMMHHKFYAYRDHLDSEKRLLEMMLARMAMQWFGYDYDDDCYVIKISKNSVDGYKWVSV